MPRMTVTYRDLTLPVDRIGEAWCIRVRDGWYFLTAADDPERVVPGFLREQLRNAHPYSPSLVASKRYPLILEIDRVIVRAWPAFVPRGRGAKTYENQATGERVLATRGPVWMFAAPKRSPSECGTTNYQQTVDDVTDLAKIWLRSSSA